MRPLRPEATIHQPMAPCRPPSAPRPSRRPVPAERDLAAGEEPQEAEAPDEADHAAELAVAPFPPVDDLELVEGHAPVDELVLRNLAVLVEFGLPRCGIERRQRTGDRAPFGDREAEIREAGHAANGDHHHDEGEEDREPDRDGAARRRGLALAGVGAAGQGRSRRPPRRCCGSCSCRPPVPSARDMSMCAPSAVPQGRGPRRATCGCRFR